MTAADLTRLLAPTVVAAVGASTGRERLSGRTIENLRRFGFGGTVVPVNPDRPEVAGLPAVASIAEVPGRVDVAFVSVPPKAVEQTLRDAAAAGVPFAIVLTAGYEGPAGRDARASLEACVAEVGDRGTRVLGPNCIGVVNPWDALMLRPAMFVRAMPPPGGIAVVSQSGGLSLAVLNEAAAWGIGLRQLVHTGNEFDLGVEDFMAHAATDPECTAIALSIEQIRRPEEFAAHARTAAERGKRLVYLKVGRSRLGREATMTHTGAIAGDAAVYDAFLAQLGFLRADTPRQLLLAADRLWPSAEDARRPLGVVSISGGEAGLAADLAEDAGVALSAPARLPRLERLIGAHAANPVDVTGRVFGEPELIEAAVHDLGEAPDAGPVLVSFPPMSAEHFAQFTAPLASARSSGAGVAVVCSGVSENAFASASALRANGIAAFESLAEAFWAFAVVADRPPVDAPVGPGPPGAAGAGTGKPAVHLSAVFDGLRAAGVPVAAMERLHPHAAPTLRFPVAVKVEHPSVYHRARHGLLRLDVGDPAAATSAAHALLARSAELGLDGPHVIAQEMGALDAPSELIVGYRRDAVFGDVLIVGRGGVTAGLAPDRDGRDTFIQVTSELSRAAAAAVEEACRRGWTTVAAGEPRAAVAAAVARCWRLAADDGFAEFEFNPLLVDDDGHCLVVDGVGWR